ncbi:MAG: aminotransferase class I/II-fold pyridoxal phosphate-dependent enzyme [Gammaproteobacteria bacterium]|nr:aminotransferase class I/II-fold pyridoxal phosphate-dependent enzyme [Gammaproteobacteria bacterium]
MNQTTNQSPGQTIQSKLPDVGTTIFTVMSKLAQDHGAINLSQGFPDFEPEEALLDRVSHYLKTGKNQYPPMIGVPELRQAISSKFTQTRGVDIDPDTEITITSGATEALFCAIHSVVQTDDEVIVFDPAYDSYEPAITLAGGKTIHLPLTLPDYQIDWDALGSAITDRTRLIIINTPHNPTGAILQERDLDRIAGLIENRNCYLLSDEVYEHIIFDDEIHASAVSHPVLRHKSFAVFSFGKTYHATGWKIGYCIAPPELTVEFRKIHQFNAFTTVTPMQWALADFINDHPQNYLELPAFYQHKRDLFRSLITRSRFKLLPSRGTYFQLADYSDISDLKDTDFANWMTIEKGVAVIPLSPFYQTAPDTRIIRFCFAKQDDTLAEAAKIICAV